jgi:hypothetical protein
LVKIIVLSSSRPAEGGFKCKGKKNSNSNSNSKAKVNLPTQWFKVQGSRFKAAIFSNFVHPIPANCGPPTGGFRVPGSGFKVQGSRFKAFSTSYFQLLPTII